MRIAVFGLGYVGTVCGTCLAYHKHHVIGVDIQRAKADLINNGIAPVVEPGLQELLADVVTSGHFEATVNSADAMKDAEVIFLCVGTPSQADGTLNMAFLKTVIKEVAANLCVAAEFPVIAIRSTVPPGTLAACEKLISEATGGVAGVDFGVVLNPEFLREGSALADFDTPPYTVIGTEHQRAAEVMKKLYSHVQAPFLATSIGAAEMIKYVNNSFHALKITFANEIGLLCKSFGIDSHEVMDLVCRDKQLNISPTYLKPGLAYGGSCLPKDLAALNHASRSHGLTTPVLAHIAESNFEHLSHAIRMIDEAGKQHVGILGLSFKAQTDDLRESPAVAIVQNLIQRGYQVRIFDPSINIARLIGANRKFIDSSIENLPDMLVASLKELLDFAETVVVTNNDTSYSDVLNRVTDQHIIIDMTRLPNCPTVSGERYHGICW